MKYVIGIDIGTTNTKAIAYSLSGNVIAQSNRTYVFSAVKEGYHELDPELLFNSVTDVLRQTISAIPDDEPAAVSFSSAMHGIMAVDASGKPLTPLVTWADLRSRHEASALRTSSLGASIYQRTGTPIHPMSPLCKLIWMRRHAPGVFSDAHKFISIKEYVFFRLFGEYIVDRSIASATGLLDIHDLDWCGQALQAAGIGRERLSVHAAATHYLKGLKKEFAAFFGISRNVPFVLGGSDGCLAHLGSNALHRGDVSITIGTSGAVRMMSDQPVNDSRQRIFSYLLTDDIYISGGPTNNGGNVLQWFAKNILGRTAVDAGDLNELVEAAFRVDAGCGGLVFLPYIYGERAPVWDADAKGVWYGVSGTHTSAHFMRSAMEGISFGLAGILQTLTTAVGPAGKIFSGGGFIRSPQWVGLLADVLGLEVAVTGSDDSSAAGAAIIGMQAIGAIKDFGEAATFFGHTETFRPDMDKHRLYQGNREIYSSLYDRLRDIKN